MEIHFGFLGGMLNRIARWFMQIVLTFRLPNRMAGFCVRFTSFQDFAWDLLLTFATLICINILCVFLIHIFCHMVDELLGLQIPILKWLPAKISRMQHKMSYFANFGKLSYCSYCCWCECICDWRLAVTVLVVVIIFFMETTPSQLQVLG